MSEREVVVGVKACDERQRFEAWAVQHFKAPVAALPYLAGSDDAWAAWQAACFVSTTSRGQQ
jgi:hypothetical protein